MGADLAHGPVARAMRWAYQTPDDQLRLIHIRDWHNAEDPQQKAHLSRFGEHCIAESLGAQFAFQVDAECGKDIPLIDTVVLNDFTEA